MAAKSLMIALMVVMRDELGDRSSYRPFADKDQPIQAGFLDGAYIVRRVRIQIRRARRQAHRFDTGGGEGHRRPGGIPISCVRSTTMYDTTP